MFDGMIVYKYQSISNGDARWIWWRILLCRLDYERPPFLAAMHKEPSIRLDKKPRVSGGPTGALEEQGLANKHQTASE